MNKQYNNLNLIRILAALQVALLHGIKYFELDFFPFFHTLREILIPFPGVPIFFAISGFLILKSYKNRINDKYSFWQSRILRLFPALIVCSALTFILLLIESYPMSDLLLWFAGQISIFQFYTPAALRTWGVGTPNGSLWTICIEMQFYLLVPLIYLLIKNRHKAIVLVLLFILSYIFSVWADSLNSKSLVHKLLDVTLIPYLFFFIIGIGLQEYWNSFKSFVEDKFLIWFSLYVIYYILVYNLHLSHISYTPNLIGLLGYFLLLMAVFSFAYSYTALSDKLLGDIDISYGIYLYHMVVLNLVLAFSCNKLVKLGLWFFLTIILSIFSWFWIEKKAMDFKQFLSKKKVSVP